MVGRNDALQVPKGHKEDRACGQWTAGVVKPQKPKKKNQSKYSIKRIANETRLAAWTHSVVELCLRSATSATEAIKSGRQDYGCKSSL